MQSEQEKELNKQLRKEEKRLARQEARAGGCTTSGENQFFDPQYLCMQR